MKEELSRKQKPKFISPAKILEDIGLRSSQRVIDYGSGAGHWAMAAARIVGPGGQVVALDDDSEMLDLVMSQAQSRRLSNIETLEVGIKSAKVEKLAPADVVIASNVMHRIFNKVEVAKVLEGLVSENGKLVVLDWVPGKMMLGPDERLRVTEEEMIKLFEKTGLKLACAVDTGWLHFGLVFDRVGDGCGWKDK